MPSAAFHLLAAATLTALGSAIAVPSPALIERSLVQRDLQSPVSGLPACDSKSTDPTWAVGTSEYTDGEGVNVGNTCDNGQGGSGHCWTDYFLVGTTDAYQSWYQAIGDIQCPANGTGSCAQAVSHLSQTCTSFEWSVTETLTADFEFELGKFGGSVSSTQGQTYQSCNNNVTTSTCTWTDGACHSVWAAQRITTVHGYKRRTCASPTSDTSANMPNTAQRSDGYYTRGMQDFAIPLTGVSAVECEGSCDPSYNPGAAPSLPNNGALTPWPTQ